VLLYTLVMSNTYFVTLSYNVESSGLYQTALDKLYADPKNSKILNCFQLGKTGKHPHYHLVIETDTEVIQKFRMRFRTYMNPIKPTKVNLDIKHAPTPGCTLNYFARDPSSIVSNIRGWDMDALKKEALAHPDPNDQLPELPWSQVYRKLLAAGWKYPEYPGKYLKTLSEYWYVYHIICNPKKLSLILNFEGKPDDWNDCYKKANNINKELFS